MIKDWKNSVDWSQIKIIFISFFSQYQKDSVNFKDLPIELYESDNMRIIFYHNKIESKSSSSSINDLSNSGVIGKVKEVTVYTEDYHLYEKTKV